MDSMSIAEVQELADIAQDTLDDVWKQTEFDPPYPEKRMKHLMDVMGKTYC